MAVFLQRCPHSWKGSEKRNWCLSRGSKQSCFLRLCQTHSYHKMIWLWALWQQFSCSESTDEYSECWRFSLFTLLPGNLGNLPQCYGWRSWYSSLSGKILLRKVMQLKVKFFSLMNQKICSRWRLSMGPPLLAQGHPQCLCFPGCSSRYGFLHEVGLPQPVPHFLLASCRF